VSCQIRVVVIKNSRTYLSALMIAAINQWRLDEYGGQFCSHCAAPKSNEAMYVVRRHNKIR
jgi:hypothetical protein